LSVSVITLLSKGWVDDTITTSGIAASGSAQSPSLVGVQNSHVATLTVVEDSISAFGLLAIGSAAVWFTSGKRIIGISSVVVALLGDSDSFGN